MTVRISLAEAVTLAESALSSLGYTPEESATIADHLIDCELRGLEYSGLARIISIGERLGSVADDGRITVHRESPVSLQLDGGDRIGYLVGAEATRLLVEKAQRTGLAVVGATRTWYTGMLSYYAERITSAGMVALLASNTTAWVAPVGGTEAMVGTNPICFGFPGETTPVIWDIGTSEIIHAQATIAHRTGKPLPEEVAYDADGNPTTDPIAALDGAFVSWGGHRGSGLGIVVQLLGALVGAPALPGQLRDFGFFALAVSPELFGEPGEFARTVSGYADALRASRPRDPAVPVRVPFERSATLRSTRRAAGVIDLDDVVHEAVTRIARNG